MFVDDRQAPAILLVRGVDRAIENLHADLKKLIRISHDRGSIGLEASANFNVEALPLRL
jgi:hypothetical protein